MSISESPQTKPEPEAEPEPTSEPTSERIEPISEPTLEPTESNPETESGPGSETDMNSISCTWKSSFQINHEKGCKKLNNEFSVPYECVGDGDGGKNVCCTVSIIETPFFERFGTCTKK
jgi:hypothetical protein